MHTTDAPATDGAGTFAELSSFIDQHRRMLSSCPDDLTEDEARRRLVPSRTTLLGLVRHATFVERVWFEEARTGASRRDLGGSGRRRLRPPEPRSRRSSQPPEPRNRRSSQPPEPRNRRRTGRVLASWR